jgi:hypothetical protein
MNVFFLDSNPKKAAEYHCDKHCVKMILESAQLLSSAHRVLDGKKEENFLISKKTGKKRKYTTYVLENKEMNENLYSVYGINLPSTVWTRSWAENYKWVFQLFTELLNELYKRYGTVHKSKMLLPYLSYLPQNIWHRENGDISEPPKLVGKDNNDLLSYDVVTAYRESYKRKKIVKTWKNGKPFWYD